MKKISKMLSLFLVSILVFSVSFSLTADKKASASEITKNISDCDSLLQNATDSSPRTPTHRTEYTFFTPVYVETISQAHCFGNGYASVYGQPNTFTGYFSTGGTTISYGVGLYGISISLSIVDDAKGGLISLSNEDIIRLNNGEIYNRLFFRAKIYKEDYRVDYYIIANDYLERSEYYTRYFYTNSNGLKGAVDYFCNPISA